jgi:hypothetical protein
MCVTFRFYHLCGHIHRISTFPCTYNPTPLKPHPLPSEGRHPASPGSAYRPLVCLSDLADSPEEIRLFPTLCKKCEQVGIISEWLGRTPGSRVEVIRAWNNTHRPEISKQRTIQNEIAELESFDVEEGDSGSDATKVKSERTDIVDQQSSTMLVDSPLQAKPASRSQRIGTDSSWLRQRIEVLKTRVRECLAELKKG